MNSLNHQRITELIESDGELSLSLYMPTHRAGRERQQDEVRLKNLIKEAQEKLIDCGRDSDTVKRTLEPLNALQDDESIWSHRGEALACFCRPEFFRAYHVPYSVEEQVIVEDRFFIRPLLGTLQCDVNVYILALTQQSATLYEATKHSVVEIERVHDEFSPDDGLEQSLQYHAHKKAVQGRGAIDEAIFHGQGGSPDRSKKTLVRYFRLVDQVVAKRLRGQRAPLVLACVGYLAPLYDSVNSYPNLIKGKVPGAPDRWGSEELRDHAWKLVEPLCERKQQEAWAQFEQHVHQDRASNDLQEIVLAADQGRIETLFLVRGEERWGQLDREKQSVHLTDPNQESEPLLDYSAAKTIISGGEVYVLDSIPDLDSPAAATFRF